MEFRAEIKRTLTGPDKLRAVCSVILDDCFLVKNVRVVEGEKRDVRVPAQPQECKRRMDGTVLPHDEGTAGEAVRRGAG